jgi:competence protein ComEC
MQDKIFYTSCFGFVLGVFLSSFVSVNFYFAVFGVGISFVLILLTYFTKLKWGVIFSVLVFTFSIGVLRFESRDFFLGEASDELVGIEHQGTGIIMDDPDTRENSQKLVVEEDISGLKTKYLLTTNLSEEYKYGDKIRFSGTIEEPENFTTDQGKDFDYVNYLKKDGILYVMSYPDIEVISSWHGNFIKSALFSIKRKFLEKVNMAIPEPENLLMGGLILGEKASFSQELRQNFVDTGTIHIVALSGYNVTIVAEWFMKLFSFLPQNLGIGVGIIAILLFVLMSGGSSTAVRAGIMASLVLVARATGRNYDVARALVLALVIMILFNPFILVYDVSFQLSFIATIAVIFFTPKVEKYFLWVPETFKLRDIISVTFAAYIFVLPFILYKMGNLSLVALPANILILPFIPITMLLGFLTGLFGIIWYVLAVPLGYASYWLLHYELGIVNFFANIHFAAISVPNFPLILVVLIYAYFTYMLFGRSIKEFFTRANQG